MSMHRATYSDICAERSKGKAYRCGRPATRFVSFDDGRTPVRCCGFHAQRFKRMPFATIQKR